jgi:putative transposase
MSNNDELYFQDKYRIPSARLKDWDYRSSGSYFVTICTKNMLSCFGDIVSGKMELNELGSFADDYLKGINDHKDNVRLINHIIMPNHVHVLLIMNNITKEKQYNRFGPLISDSLSSLINHFKGRVTKFANQNQLHWIGWQERFHDHVIRDQSGFDRINQYISSNPSLWQTDRYFRNNPM